MKTIFYEALKGGPGSGRHPAGGEVNRHDPSKPVPPPKVMQEKDGIRTKEGVGTGKFKYEAMHLATGMRADGATVGQAHAAMQKIVDRLNTQRKSSSFKALSDNIETRVDELSLKGGPGSGRHAGTTKEEQVHSKAASLHDRAARFHDAAEKGAVNSSDAQAATAKATEASQNTPKGEHQFYAEKAQSASDRGYHLSTADAHRQAATEHRQMAK